MRKYVYFPLKIDSETIEGVRKALAESLELLKQNRPDTFLGRKSYEPFPSEATPSDAGGENGGGDTPPA
ncbi:conserved protein of unknown function [Bradyrhizobium sp. ORS 285]|uniref:hypothetical protein n=1 Tax=Bradyrhizobium sp. ORS 285 TaxID=115808 RepID=UPI0002408A01|nr:hypothetical protein [Bradyrhizobium sp. ORS 285]CCD87449.1 conserved hypothetical protein [Bradyrhizobium sp. ORS 285]SMX59054.1 conserved protein of unknown function [Bradyrhizobium sp. ORS 285]